MARCSPALGARAEVRAQRCARRGARFARTFVIDYSEPPPEQGVPVHEHMFVFCVVRHPNAHLCMRTPTAALSMARREI